MIQIRSLSKQFGSVQALDSLNLEIAPGELAGLLGPNGAGKSTSLKCVMGLLQPDEGTITVNGRSSLESPLEVKREIGYVPEDPALFPNLTPREFITMSGRLYLMDAETIRVRIEGLSKQFDFEDQLDTLNSELSKGMKQKCLIIAALLHDPALLILDEPFSGLDAASSSVFKEELRRRTLGGGTVIISSHVMEVVERLCTRVHIISNGRQVASGSVDEITESQNTTNFEEAFIHLTGKASEHSKP